MEEHAQQQDIETLRGWIRNTRPGGMVFFGGAGVSTESGIPDFRSPDGLYSQKHAKDFPYPAEVMLSRSFFDAHPDMFFDYYFSQMIAQDAKPNRAHLKLAELERDGTLRAVVTQNIDGLHQAAGSTNVLELHGSVLRNHCMGCGASYTLDEMLKLHDAAEDGVPRCPVCGDIVKPDVVLYEEALDEAVLQASIDAISQADLLVIGGTSLTVYPAAGLIQYFEGPHLAIVNNLPTSADRYAELCIACSIGEVFDF